MAVDRQGIPSRTWLAMGLLAAIFLAGSHCTGASEGDPVMWRWQPYDQGLPAYAMAMTVAVQPTDPAVIYVGTYEPPGLWCSDDRGHSWVADDTGLGGSPVYALYWDRTRNRWLAGARNGLYARLATGISWQATGLEEHVVYALAGDERGRLYAATEDGLFRSSDGMSWEALPIGGAPGMTVLALDVSPDGRVLMAGTAGDGLWISNDGGAAWMPAASLSTEVGKALTQAYISAVLLDARPAGAAYASTSERAYRSTDGSTTWQPIPGLEGRVYAWARDANGNLYAALSGQVARSTDGGHTWLLSDAGLRPGDKVLDLALAPDDPSCVYAGAWDGLYVSNDGGQSWGRRDNGLGYADVNVLGWDGSGNLLAGTRSGLYRSKPDAATWDAVPDIQGQSVLSLADAGDEYHFYAGCSGGLFLSTDGGHAWAEVPSELSEASIAGLSVDEDDPDHLHAWVAFGRVHESRDGGWSWVARWEGLGDVRPVTAIHRAQDGQLYVGAEDGIFRWEAARQAWQPLPFPLIAPTILVIETDTRDAGAVYVGAIDGLWRSPDDGQTWARWGAGLAGTTVTALAISPADQRIAFAGTRHMGLYMSTDGGASWQPAWQGRMATASVRDILFSLDGRSVYVASNQGIWRGGADGAR